jgi:hypothetical protein
VGFSDDHTSSAASFSGDSNFFESPDVVRTSPTTTERVVDTQSGFLVVLKQVDSRLALSVKRRLGTPPVSSIFLTPDECLKLSRILASNEAGKTVSGRLANNVSGAVDNWLDSVENLEEESAPPEDSDDLPYTPAIDHHQRTFVARRPRSRSSKRSATPALEISKKQIAIGIAIAVLIPVTAFAANSLLHRAHGTPPKPVAVEDLETARFDKFARTFVADMLDFNPKTYRVSQVQAMASMVPDLMDKYWQETHFPLSPQQLKSSPQGLTLMITKVTQQRLADTNRDLDIFAELVSTDSKISSPVHLKLTVGTGEDGQLRILDQKDLSPPK